MVPADKKTMGDRRRALDMSIGECARACGLGTSVMSRIERGLENPPDAVVSTIASVLKCTPEEIRAGLPTAEEVAQLEKRAADALEALVAVQADAMAHGLRRGKGGTGRVQCPVCGDGEIRYSVAESNGHIWASCSTHGCVRWMQ